MTYTHEIVAPFISIFVPSVTIHGIQRKTNEPFGPCNAGDGVS